MEKATVQLNTNIEKRGNTITKPPVSPNNSKGNSSNKNNTSDKK